MCLQARNQMDYRIKRLTMELENVGNVRFEDGTSSDSWYVRASSTTCFEKSSKILILNSVKLFSWKQIFNSVQVIKIKWLRILINILTEFGKNQDML